MIRTEVRQLSRTFRRQTAGVQLTAEGALIYRIIIYTAAEYMQFQ